VSRAIWGCDVYTDDSDIFSCVVHSGAFVPFDIDIFTPTSDEQQGGHGLEPVIGRRNYDGCASMDLMVTIQMLPRLQQYLFTNMR
jgi:Histone deacetylation protein Rxt3